MIKCSSDYKIPNELLGEDVNDLLIVFENEEEMINYVMGNYSIDKDSFLKELYEEDFMRDDYGAESFPRGASIKIDLHVRELLSGEYILWESY